MEAVEPITMRDLGGVIICGKRGGKPFIEAVRPNSEGICPDFTLPCSTYTSLENTICMTMED